MDQYEKAADYPKELRSKEKELPPKGKELSPNEKDRAENRTPEEEKKAYSETEKTTKQLLIGFLGEILLIALAVWAALSFVVCVRIHYGNNMFPAIRDGDLVVTYRLQRPFLNAAVLYEREGKLRLGRVVGMPGHVINISDEGVLTVNNVIPAEEVFYPTVPAEGGEISYPYTVGEGQVFILNDFRVDTADSRTFGAVDLKDVKGPLLLSMRRRGFYYKSHSSLHNCTCYNQLKFSILHKNSRMTFIHRGAARGMGI